MHSQPKINSERWITLFIAAVSSFITPFMSSSMNVALRLLGTDMSMSAVLLGWVNTSYSLAAAVFLVPIGKVADIVGRKKIFLWGLAIYTLGSLFCAIVPNASLFIFFRVIQGIGSAFIYATSIAILTSVFPASERGRVLGITTAATYLGLSLGPVLGGFLTAFSGWRSIFWINVPLGLLILWLTLWKLKGEWAEAAGEGLDWTGSVIYGVSLAIAILGLPRIPSFLGIGMTIIGFLGMVGFIRWESRLESPILNVGLFKNNRVFTFSNLAALINYSATAAVGFLLSLYLQHIKALSPQQAGLILVAQPAVMALISPLSGRLSDKIPKRSLASAGMALTTLALIPLVFLNSNTAIWTIILYLLILGLGFGLFSSPNVNAIMSSVEKKSYGVASATLATMRLIGQTSSMVIVTLIFALYMGQVAITPENYLLFLASLKPAFAIFSGLCFIGIFASLARGNH